MPDPLVDVLVVGAGPTGLLLGTELALAGAAVVVVDAAQAPSGQAKGGGIQPRTAELLDLRAMMDPLLAHAVPGEPTGGHFGGLPVALDCTPWRTRHPHVSPVPQGHIEEFLTGRLAELGVTVRRGLRLTDLRVRDDTVHATLHDTAAGTDRQLPARYLVACDGAHSTVRAVVGAPFPGEAGTRPAVLADIRLAATSDLVPVRAGSFGSMVRDGGGYWSMLSPLRDGWYRFVFGPFAPADADHRGERPVSPEEVRRALHAVWGADTELAEIGCASRFSDAVRQLERYRHGPVLFAGDAAHIHPPLGGQGLNLGIQDAFNLGWKLAAEVRGRAPAGLLDSYHAERHPVAARVLHHVRAQRVLAERRPSADVAALRDIVTDLARLPDANRYLAGLVSGLDLRYPMPGGGDHPLLGARMPDIELSVDGATRRVSSFMHAGRGLLLDLTADGRIGSGLAGHGGIDVVRAGTREEFEAEAVLLRPDGYVCWVTACWVTACQVTVSRDAAQGAELDAAVDHWFGTGHGAPAGGGSRTADRAG